VIFERPHLVAPAADSLKNESRTLVVIRVQFYVHFHLSYEIIWRGIWQPAADMVA